MGKKKQITRLGNTPSSQPSPTNIPFPQINVESDEHQNTLQQMLASTNHTSRIDALNTISALFKSNTVHSITQNNLYRQVVDLMGDKMMNVALAATSLLRNVVQICDSSLLNFFIAHKLHHACYALLQNIFPLFINFTNNVVIAKGHGLFWYNPNYLSMVRILNHVAKILASLFECNDQLTAEFNTFLLQAEHEQQLQPDPSFVPKINMLSFFFQLLSIKLHSIPPHIIPTIHSPFITQLQIDIYHLLRVLSHENITMTQRFLSEPTIIQHLLQEPLQLLALHQQIASTISTTPDFTHPTDSLYTYQYCASIALSNLHNEYQKVITQSKKTSALATTFVLHSVPHSNIELSMSIAIIIANMLEQINLQPHTFLSNDQQIKTIESLYTTFSSVIQYTLTNIDIKHELSTYTQSLQQIRSVLTTISNGDLSLLEQYNLSTTSAMMDATTISPVAQAQAQRNQFKALNINNPTNAENQQSMLVASLQQLAVQMDGQIAANLQDLEQEAQPMDEEPMSQPSSSSTSPSMLQPFDDDVSDESSQPQPFSHDEFPIQQLWNDAIQVHNNILIQYYNIETLVGDCFTMLLTDHFIVEDEEEQLKKAKQPQSPQLDLFHQQMAQILTPANAFCLLNHSYSHFPLHAPTLTTLSYFPIPLIGTIHELFNTNQLDYITHSSYLSYQSTLLRLTSLQSFLLLLQFHIHQKSLITTFGPQLTTIHTSLLSLVAATSIANIPQPQQTILQPIQEHFIALSALDSSGDLALSKQSNAIAQIGGVLTSSTIDEAVLVIRSLALFVCVEDICDTNQALWKSSQLKQCMANVAPLKNKVYLTESLNQNDINQIVSSLPEQQQKVTLYVSEQFATQLQNFLGYIVTAQHLTQKNTINTSTQNQRLFENSPQVDFQHVVLEYISTMAQYYPLFGPVVPKLIEHCTSLISHFILLKSSQFNAFLLFQFINLIIDVFSEDDRYILSYTQNKLTPTLGTFAKVHSEYFSWLKQLKLTFKPKSTATKNGKKTIGASSNTTTLTPQKQQQLIKLQEEFEITSESNSNLISFIQYKKGFGL